MAAPKKIVGPGIISALRTKVLSLIENQVAAKQDTLVSGKNIKTISGQNILGSGNIKTFSGPYSIVQQSKTQKFPANTWTRSEDLTNKKFAAGTYLLQLSFICDNRKNSSNALRMGMVPTEGDITGISFAVEHTLAASALNRTTFSFLGFLSKDSVPLSFAINPAYDVDFSQIHLRWIKLD